VSAHARPAGRSGTFQCRRAAAGGAATVVAL